MSRKYKFKDQTKPYFVTLTIVNWIDLFTRDVYKECLVNSLRYCQKNKGLVIYGWCFMTNHIHMVIGTKDQPMQDILRDFKSFTSRSLKIILSEMKVESRKEWMLNMFYDAGNSNNNNNDWQFWQQHNHPIELYDNCIKDQKLSYLHDNPVKAGFVTNAEDWIWSSAYDYAGGKGLLDIEFL